MPANVPPLVDAAQIMGNSSFGWLGCLLVWAVRTSIVSTSGRRLFDLPNSRTPAQERDPRLGVPSWPSCSPFSAPSIDSALPHTIILHAVLDLRCGLMFGGSDASSVAVNSLDVKITNEQQIESVGGQTCDKQLQSEAATSAGNSSLQP